jgi:hypothetical protein
MKYDSNLSGKNAEFVLSGTYKNHCTFGWLKIMPMNITLKT